MKPPLRPHDTEVVPVFYIQPEDSNLGAVGFNLFSNPARKQAMLKAKDTGANTVTARIVLQQEREGAGNYGVLYITPVYRSKLTPASLTPEVRHGGCCRSTVWVSLAVGLCPCGQSLIACLACIQHCVLCAGFRVGRKIGKCRPGKDFPVFLSATSVKFTKGT